MTLTGRIEEIIDCMKEKKLDLLGISETKWKGKGNMTLRDGYRLYWSGGKEAKNGVGFIMRGEIQDHLEQIKYVSDRIIKAKIWIGGGTKEFVQVYAPQSGNREESIEDFLAEVEREISDKDTVIMGDLNAQVGKERSGVEEIVGPYGYGKRNYEGEKLLEFCERNDLIVSNSWFRKKNSRKITRYGWGERRTKTVIDYFLVEKMKRREIMDVSVLPGEAFESDHRLVVAKFRVGRIKRMKEYRQKKIKVWRLKEPQIQARYLQEVEKMTPRTNIGEVEEEWKMFKEEITKCAERVCGRTSGKRKERETKWWNERVKNAVKEKKEMWRIWDKNREEESRRKYEDAKRKCKRVVNEEKKKCLEELAGILEEDVSRGKRILYGMVKEKKRGSEGEPSMIKNETGNVLVEETDIRSRWKEYFEKLLNTRRNTQNSDREEYQEVEEVAEEEITMTEIEVASKKMRLGKAPGVDEVTIDMVRAAGKEGLYWISRVFQAVWRDKRTPEEWKKGIIIPIFKKGDRKRCENYRGVTLISHIAKLFERILENRIRKKVEKELQEEQYGFRRDRSTNDLIFAMRQVMEKRWEFGKELVMTFLDLEKAYDSVPRERVWRALKEKKISKELIEMIKDMYEGCKSCVRTRVGTTEWFEVKTGLRQGSVLSPLLFIITMDTIQKQVKEILGKEGTAWLFADDIVIIGENEEEVQEQVDIWNARIEEWGLKINRKKSMTMVMTRGNREGRGRIKIGDEESEVVENFRYLGSEIQQDGRIDREIGRRTQVANGFYQSVRGLIWGKEVPRRCKMTLYKAYYIPILTYSSATWTLGKREESRLQAAEMKFLRSMVGKTKRDRIKNEEIRKMVGVDRLRDQIGRTQLAWFGHVKRKGESELARRMLEQKIRGKRPRGRPRRRWIDGVKEEIERRGIKAEKIFREQRWKDRKKWRSLILCPT
uniref:Endonuclease-reverse transcriptase HmRTE-e01 n=1 Tax=Hadrurus spadix TaxID=141984 RepID=A0A1W7R9N5_9SCOR